MSPPNSMPFSHLAWQQTATIYQKILAMPFNRELADGTLAADKFQHYLIQDAHYLEGFARSLSLLSAKGLTADHVVHFAKAAETAIVVERSLHANYMRQFGISHQQFQATPPTPACEHYVSFLLRVAALEPFEVGLACLLPCFWIYREVGKTIAQNHAPDNPFQAWIDTYAGADFETAVDHVIQITDQVAEFTSELNQNQMFHRFQRAVQLEYMFWDSAYGLDQWPV